MLDGEAISTLLTTWLEDLSCRPNFPYKSAGPFNFLKRPMDTTVFLGVVGTLEEAASMSLRDIFLIWVKLIIVASFPCILTGVRYSLLCTR